MVARAVSAENNEIVLTLWEAGMPAEEIAKHVGWAGRTVVTRAICEWRELGEPRAVRRRAIQRKVVRR